MNKVEDAKVVGELAYHFMLLDIEIERLKEENKDLKVRLESSHQNIGVSKSNQV